MRAWIFQAKPEQYEIKNIRENEEETWLVTRYRREMGQGDIVFFWRAGNREERGIYGWGNIVDREPREIDDWGYGVRVEYRRRFGKFISVDDLENEGVLSDNLILRMPIGTNFRVSQEELEELARLIRGKGEQPPEPGAEEPT
jgi:predicted RNA-binding protein with PUA-like domain